jgi:hypothetical protein
MTFPQALNRFAFGFSCWLLFWIETALLATCLPFMPLIIALVAGLCFWASRSFSRRGAWTFILFYLALQATLVPKLKQVARNPFLQSIESGVAKILADEKAQTGRFPLDVAPIVDDVILHMNLTPAQAATFKKRPHTYDPASGAFAIDKY